MNVLGIIPARGGSKSVPLKNIRMLCGKPLLAYSIESASKARSLTRLIVSSDHAQIIEIARQFGAETVLRPPELATDEASTESVLLHVLDELRDRGGYEPEVVLTLEPTSPFRTAGLIDRCVDIFRTTDADSVIGVVETRSCYGKIVNGHFQYLFPGQPRRRQEREPLYRESSTLYATRTGILRTKKSVIGNNLYPLVVPEEEAIDINSLLDFEFAELSMKSKGRRGGS